VLLRNHAIHCNEIAYKIRLWIRQSSYKKGISVVQIWILLFFFYLTTAGNCVKTLKNVTKIIWVLCLYTYLFQILIPICIFKMAWKVRSFEKSLTSSLHDFERIFLVNCPKSTWNELLLKNLQKYENLRLRNTHVVWAQNHILCGTEFIFYAFII